MTLLIFNSVRHKILCAILLFSSSCFVLAEQGHAQQISTFEVSPQSAEPIFVATVPVRTQIARAYVPDGGQDSARYQSDLARLGFEVGQYISLTEANLGQALRDEDMLAVLPANLIANPVAGLMEGGYFAFRPTPDGFAPVRITTDDGRSLEPIDLELLASVPPAVITLAEPETALIAGIDLPRSGQLDLMLHNMRVDTGILRTLLGRSGFTPGRVQLAGPGEVLDAVRDGSVGVLFLSASQNDQEITALRDIDGLDTWVATNFGLVPAWPASFGPVPSGSLETGPADTLTPVTESETDGAGQAIAQAPDTQDDTARPPVSALPAAGDPSYSVTDADAVVLILPATLLPADLARIVGVPRALIRELDVLRERRYYEPYEPEFSEDALSRMTAMVGVRSVALQPDNDWLQVIDGEMPQAILDNLMRRQQGLAIHPSDLADPELAPVLADPRIAFWELRADGIVRIADPVPDPMPRAVAFSDLPDHAVLALMAAGTDLSQVPTERIFNAGGLRFRENGTPVGAGIRGPDDQIRRLLVQAAVQTLGASEQVPIRSINYVHVDVATGTVEAQPGGAPEPLGDRVLLFRAETLRDARVSAMRASAENSLYYLAFGRAIPVDGAGDVQQIDLDAHRVARSRIVAEEGGLLALPVGGAAPAEFLHFYQDRNVAWRAGRLPDGRWHFAGPQTAMSPQDVGGRFQNVIVGGSNSAVQFESMAGQGVTKADLALAFKRDEAAFLVMPPRRSTQVDLALSEITDALFDGSHSFISVSRGVQVEIVPLP